MALIDPPAFLGLAGNEYPAARLRRAHQLLLAAREGVIRDLPAYPTPLAVTQTGTPSLSVQVAAGAAVINGDDSSRQGAYLVENDAAVTIGPVDTPHATLPRIDRVVLRVYDQEGTGTGGGGAASDAPALEIITGTPASTPAAPAEPPTAITLALVTVGPGASSIVNADIADGRTLFRLAALPITTSGIADAAITAALIASGAVTEPKIASGAITGPKIASGAVGADALAENTNDAIILANSWTATGGSYHAPSAQKDPTNRVHLRGVVTSPGDANTTIGTVPAGYRPWATEVFMVASNPSGGWGLAVVQIASTGTITVLSSIEPNRPLSLSGVTYHTNV